MVKGELAFLRSRCAALQQSLEWAMGHVVVPDDWQGGTVKEWLAWQDARDRAQRVLTGALWPVDTAPRIL
jgi:hypothetical protein